ncbi:MAG TPA: hypothetical protein VKC11_07475 [Steroidobacteraceae bacterium]|nr:hypothetical protein [Steroidobacteraceae bacterium]
MKEFFILLFFSKTSLLTAQPIAIDSKCIDVPLKVPLEVLNPGATLQVEVAYVATDRWFDDLGRLYPKGSVTGTFTRSDRTRLLIANSSVARGQKSSYLLLAPKEGYRSDDKFSALQLCSAVSLVGVRVYWQNASK